MKRATGTLIAIVLLSAGVKAQNTITFQADLSSLIRAGFDSALDSIVVNGSFNGWSSAKRMAATGTPGLYSYSIDASGIGIGQTIQYKFKAFPDSKFGNSGWENDQPTTSHNREYVNEGGNVSLSPVQPAITVIMSIPVIQQVSLDSLRLLDILQADTTGRSLDDSPSWRGGDANSDTVTITGVVLAKPPILTYTLARYNVFIQDTSTGRVWGGLDILTNDTSVAAQSTGIAAVDTGDVITVVGRVTEFGNQPNSLTEIFIYKAGYFESPQPVQLRGVLPHRPAPLEVTCDSFVVGATPKPSRGEKYEGMYVVIRNVTVNSADLATGRFTFVDDNGNQMRMYDGSTWYTLRGHRNVNSTYSPPTIGTRLSYIRGIILPQNLPGTCGDYTIMPLYPGPDQLSGSTYSGDIGVGYVPSHAVSFRVNMKVKMREDAFRPDLGDVVSVRGSFNGWTDVDTLRDPDGDSVYVKPVPVLTGTGQYKFYKTLRKGSDWENTANRTFSVSGDSILPALYFDDDSIVSPPANVTFQVNMKFKMLEGSFRPDLGDIVNVAGDFNGWSTTSDTLRDPNVDSVYTKTLTVFQGTTIYYKFVKTLRAGLDWEQSFPTPSTNREYTVSSPSEIIPVSGFSGMPSPALVSPTDGSLNQPIQLNVNWNPVSGAKYYHLQVSTSNAFSSLYIDISHLTSTTTVGLSPGTTYYWRVQASDSTETLISSWSVAWSFTTSSTLPPPVTWRWTYSGNFFSLPTGQLGIQGMATDPSGRVWIAPYQLLDSVWTGLVYKKCGLIHVYNANGTNAPFSPIKFLVGAGVNDTIYLNARGMGTDPNGNILTAFGDALYRLDYRTGGVLNKTVPLAGQTLTAPATDSVGHIVVGHVLQGLPIHTLNPDFSPIGTVANSIGLSRTVAVTPRADRIYWPEFSATAVYVYTSGNGIAGPYTKTDSLTGLAVESMTWQPGTGLLWMSSGSSLNLPAPPYTIQTWYGFNMSNKTIVDTITWNQLPNTQNARPRAIAFSPTGDTAYVAVFSNIDTATVQRFVSRTPKKTAQLTFQADLGTLVAAGFNPATDSVVVNGSFNNWNSAVRMTPTDIFNVYRTTVTLTESPGNIVQFKFRAFPTWKFEEDGWEADQPTTSRNREYAFTGSDTTFAPLTPEIALKVFITNDVAVTFHVNMNGATEKYTNHPISGLTAVYLAGSNRPLKWPVQWTFADSSYVTMFDDGDVAHGDAEAGDNIWSVKVTFHAADTVEKKLDYKYGAVFPNVQSLNGGVTYLDNEAGYKVNHFFNLNDTSVVQTVNDFFGDQRPGVVTSTITFQATRSGLIAAGFNPSTDSVVVVGSFNGWKSAQRMHPSGDSTLFQHSITFAAIPGSILQYKYRAFPPGKFFNNGYELDQPTPSHNREFTYQGRDSLLPPISTAILGVSSKSGVLDGISGRIRVADNVPVNPQANPVAYKISGNTITVEAWVFPFDLPAHNQGRIIVMRPANGGIGVTPFQAYSLTVNNYGGSDAPRFAFEISDGTTPVGQGKNIFVSDTALPAVGKWTHLAGTYDGATAKLYVNERLVRQVGGSINIGVGSTGFYVGGLTYDYFKGLIDEVRLWNICRSQATILASMNTVLAGYESGLAGYWPLDSTYTSESLTITPDKTSNHNDLVLQSSMLVSSPFGFTVQLPPGRIAINPVYAATDAPVTMHAGANGWPSPPISFSGLAPGMAVAGSDLNWTPAPNQWGPFSVHVTALNSSGGVDSAVVLYSEGMRTVQNQITLDVANRGKLGAFGQFARGISYKGKQGLFAADFSVVARATNKYSGGLYSSTNSFKPLEGFTNVPSKYQGFTSFRTSFTDEWESNRIGLKIIQTTYSKMTAPDNKYAIMEYKIVNTSGGQLTDLFAQLSADFDVGNSGNNLGAYDSVTQTVYTYEAGGATNPYYYGFQLLNRPASGVGISIPGQDVQWFRTTTNLTTFSPTSSAPSDIRNQISTGPFALAAGETVTVAFTVMAGDTPDDLRISASQAKYVLASSLTYSHRIALPQGWSMISSYVLPADSVLDTVLVRTRSRMLLLKNGAGQVYWPSLTVNQIGAWNFRQGYQVYMSSSDTLALAGLAADPSSTPLGLGQGWSLVSYLRTTPMSADTALASLTGKLVIVKNGQGQVYWPALGINSIGTMRAGQGYQVYLVAAGTLVYPGNPVPPPPSMLTKRVDGTFAGSLQSPTHYVIQNVSTGSNATLLVKLSDVADGDEVAVLNTKRNVVGSAVVQTGRALVVVWGDNPVTDGIVEGAKPGEDLLLVVWSQRKEKSYDLTSLQNGLTGEGEAPSLKYSENSVWIGAAKGRVDIPSEFSLMQNYPNPFNPSTTIKYGLPKDSRVLLEIFNVLGQRVAVLADELQTAGFHEVQFQSGQLPSGIYFSRLIADSFVSTKKMELLK
ncbi:MAG: LamG-like jellyroll fold domain-containing protein [Bacteroidota bacterium]